VPWTPPSWRRPASARLSILQPLYEHDAICLLLWRKYTIAAQIISLRVQVLDMRAVSVVINLEGRVVGESRLVGPFSPCQELLH
jgi:hypothetical protein